jgi:hypothetical protein
MKRKGDVAAREKESPDGVVFVTKKGDVKTWKKGGQLRVQCGKELRAAGMGF